MKTKECSNCKLEKPFPGHYMISYIRQITCNECIECRHVRGKKNNRKLIGKTDPKFGWNTSVVMNVRKKEE